MLILYLTRLGLKSLVNGGKLLEAGARVVYSKAGRKFDIQIVPNGQEKQLEVHANVNYETDKIISKKRNR